MSKISVLYLPQYEKDVRILKKHNPDMDAVCIFPIHRISDIREYLEARDQYVLLCDGSIVYSEDTIATFSQLLDSETSWDIIVSPISFVDKESNLVSLPYISMFGIQKDNTHRAEDIVTMGNKIGVNFIGGFGNIAIKSEVLTELDDVELSSVLFRPNTVKLERYIYGKTLHFMEKAVTACVLGENDIYVQQENMNRIRDYISGLRDIDYTEHIEQVYRGRYPEGREKTGPQYFNGRCAVYSVITGGYDELKDPKMIVPGWDYYLYTDTPENYKSEIWQIKRIPKEYEQSSLTMTSRYLKTHPHIVLSDYDFTIYVDGKISIVGDMATYIKEYGGECSMLGFPHYRNSSLDEEAEAIIFNGKADAVELMKQIAYYRNHGYREEPIRPLLETACIVRSNHDELLKKVMEDWWYEISHRTARDQISLTYVCYRNSYKYDICDLLILHNQYISMSGHINRIRSEG